MVYDYEKEAAEWIENYMEYYDYNREHAESAFISNGYHIPGVETARKLHISSEQMKSNFYNGTEQ